MNKKSLYIVLNVALLVPSVYADPKAPVATKPVEAPKNETKAVAVAKNDAKPAEAVKKDAAAKPAVGAILANKDVKIDLSVRYVNTMEAMQTSKVGAEVSEEIDAKRKELAQNIQKQDEDLKKVMNEFKSKESMLSASARNTEEAKIAKMTREFENIYKATEDELKIAVQQATDGLFQEVEKAVTELAQVNNYDVVVDLYTGRTIFASPKAMITEDLVKGMDKSHQLAHSNKAKTPAAAVAA